MSDEDEPSTSSKIPLAPQSKRIDRLRDLSSLEFWSIYDPELVEEMKSIFEQDETFSPSASDALDKIPKDESLRDKLLNPPCFQEFKIPQVIGLASRRQQGFEKPLFDQATQLRNTLVPLTAAALLLEEEPEAAQEIIHYLLDDLTKKLKETNYKRIIAITPDPKTRKAMQLNNSHALKDHKVQKDLKAAKKLASTFSTPDRSSKSNPRPSPYRSWSERRRGETKTLQDSALPETSQTADHSAPIRRGSRFKPRGSSRA